MIRSLCAVGFLVVGLTFVARAQDKSASPTAKEDSMDMQMHATGPFEVKMVPTDNNSADGLSRFLLDKQYHGDLEGTAKGQMLTNGVDPNGSGVYVAMEKFTGTLKGRSGTFFLHHAGVMTRGTPQLAIRVVPDSGTGDLVGISGTMTIKIVDKKHFYDFEYTMPSQN